MCWFFFLPMKLQIYNGNLLKVNHPVLPVPVPTQPLTAPKLIAEKRVKKP
jgi:hypothetical protein